MEWNGEIHALGSEQGEAPISGLQRVQVKNGWKQACLTDQPTSRAWQRAFLAFPRLTLSLKSRVVLYRYQAVTLHWLKGAQTM